MNLKKEVVSALEELEYGLGFSIIEHLQSQVISALEELENVQNKNVLLQQLIKEAKRKKKEENELQKEEALKETKEMAINLKT